MNQFSPEVIKVAPGQRLRDDLIDQSGYAVIALLKKQRVSRKRTSTER